MIKTKKIGAQKGHALLKKKSDALTVRFRGMLKTIYERKIFVGKQMRTSQFSLAEAQYAAGDIKYALRPPPPRLAPDGGSRLCFPPSAFLSHQKKPPLCSKTCFPPS